MWKAKRLRVYLEDAIRDDARAGRIDFFACLREVFEARGWHVSFRPNTRIQRIRSYRLPGYSLFHMSKPWHSRSLYLRRAYAENYWRIEASERRLEWGVTRAVFDPERVDPKEALAHAEMWRRRTGADAVEPSSREGFVFIPLQGKLLEKRSFQTMSPAEMVRATLAHDNRPIRLTLHPRECYSQAERGAIAALCEDPRVTLTTEPMHALLARTDFVVTQNSSVAFWGLLHNTPAILFGEADFHHPFQSTADGVELAFDRVMQEPPRGAEYLYWFFQEHALSAEQGVPTERIADRFQELGWSL